MFACKYFLLERGLPAMQATRSFSFTVSSFIAGKRAPAGVALEVFMVLSFFVSSTYLLHVMFLMVIS
jgi:hypothetical protein